MPRVSRRSQIAQLFDRSGLTERVLRWRGQSASPWLTILTYHRVHPDAAPQLFDDGVVDATPESFDAHMGEVKRYFNVVGIDELVAYAHGTPLPPNPIAITFDDGYRDNYELALPILVKHGIRAIFFIATSFISERRTFWWDRVCYTIKKSQRKHIELSYPSPLRVDLSECESVHPILRRVKDRFDLDLDRYLDELNQAAGVPWSREIDRGFADELLMTWHQVRGLRKAGMDVQSHTRTHRVLQTLRADRLTDELTGSKQDLERELGEPVRAVSYPVGRDIATRPWIRRAVREAGYEIGFSNGSGINHLWAKFDRYNVRRMPVDKNLPFPYFRGILALPYLAPA